MPAVAYSSDSHTIVTVSEDKTWRVWDAKSGSELHWFNYAAAIVGVAVSPRGDRVALAGDDYSLAVMDLRTGIMIRSRSEIHRGAILSIAFSRLGDRILTASVDDTWSIWNASTLDQLMFSRSDANSIGRFQMATWAATDENFVTGNSDGTISL